MKNTSNIPCHIAIACDGNGRWAQQRGLDRVEGHRAGSQNFQKVAELLINYGVPCATVWTMSNENWGRPIKEVQGILGILKDALDRDSEELSRKGVRINHIGSLTRLSPHLRKKVKEVMRASSKNSKLSLNIAFDYGGKQDIVQATQKILEDNLQPEQVTEELVSNLLYTGKFPKIDLLIRTGGDRRLSNYLVWQTAGTPFYVTPVYWPDFGEKELLEALSFFSSTKK